MSETYDVGDTVTLTGAFRNAAGALANPTTIVLTVRDPAGALTTPTPSTSSTGIYTATVAPTTHGLWRYRWVGTGAVATAEEGAFNVRRRRVV